MVDSKRICALEEAEVLAAHEAAIQLGIIEPMTKEEWYDREPKFRSRTIHRLVRYCSFYFDFGQTSITLGISCPQPAQSRCAALPTAALSTVAVPIAAGPNSCWRHQSNSDRPSASSRSQHPIAGSSYGTPYGPERAASALADPLEPHLDMSLLDQVLSADTHLVRLLAAVS